uniref:Fe2OG dioxygenase domain-containing protein n=1 Tax=Leersia perrieri TaxID=77586 RepID=A0A0D9WM77_9ORYZ
MEPAAAAAAVAPPRVQALADAGVPLLPPQYVQPPDLRPLPPTDPSSVSVPVLPVVDLSAAGAAGVGDAVARACAEWGAFHVVGHGVRRGLLDAMRGAGRAFFGSPMEEKLRFACDPARGAAAEGYGSRMLANDDSVLDWRDYFDHHTLPESRRNPNHWPDFVPGYRVILRAYVKGLMECCCIIASILDTVVEYSNSMKDLAQKLLRIISGTLNVPPTYIEEAVGEVYQNITVSYYSPCPQPDLALGLQSHSDMGAITLLIQDDVGGLEVLKDGMWIPVPPLPDGILVILADQTEIISNGRYKSAVHRAIVNADRARLSVATFYDPPRSQKICTAPQLVCKEYPQKYRDVIYGDYVSSWYSKGPEGKRNIDALLIEQ